MNILRGLVVAGLAVAVLMLGSTAAYSQGACDNGGNHTIQVAAGADGRPELSYRGGSAENVHVCLGDTVRWVLIGSDRDFFVDFFGDAPFGGAAKQGPTTTVSVVIGGGAERNQSYSYDVTFANGQGLDPHIIVD